MYKRGEKKQSEFEEKVIRVSRVSKKTKGGDQMGFSVLMVVGDKKGKVGVGLGKAHDVISAIRKGVKQARKKMIAIPIDGTTIPFAIEGKFGAGHVLLKPAAKGSGVIAGGPVRAVVEAAGIKDISAKILGSENQATSVYATFAALKQASKIIKVRGIKIEQEVVKGEPKPQIRQENRSVRKKVFKRKVVTRAGKVVDKKVASKVASKVTSKQPAVKKPVAKNPVAKKSMVKKLAVKKSVVKKAKPTIKKTTVKKIDSLKEAKLDK